MLTDSKEDYLKAIAEAQTETGTVISADLSRWLGVSSAAVAMATRRLQRDGLLQVDAQGHLELTDEGRAVAHRVRERHQLLERMLSDIFGMEWYKVHDEAERLEHAISDEFADLLRRRLGDPREACPHGNGLEDDTPSARASRGWHTLDSWPAGTPGEIASVYERDRPLLEHLDALGLRPGARVRVLARNADDTCTLVVGTAAAEAGGRTVTLGGSAARRVWIRPLPAPQG